MNRCSVSGVLVVSDNGLDYAETMRYFTIALLLLFNFASGAHDIYRKVDKDGNVIFTDVPSEGAEKIQLKETTTIQSLDVEPSSSQVPTRQEEQPIPYKSVSIVNPQNDEAIRDNAGNVNIKVSIEPALYPGHEVVVYVDGEEKTSGAGTAFNLENIDRGTHQLRASIKDHEGHILVSSKSTTFHMLRQSIIQRRPGNTPKS